MTDDRFTSEELRVMVRLARRRLDQATVLLEQIGDLLGSDDNDGGVPGFSGGEGVGRPRLPKGRKPRSNHRTKLSDLVKAEKITVGDRLRLEYGSDTVYGYVSERGVSYDGADYSNPSKPAELALARMGGPDHTNGWAQWVHERTGRTLYDIRVEHQGR